MGYPTSLNFKAGDKIILTEEIKWAEPNFTEVLAFNLIKGNKKHFFDDYYSIVLSENGAKKLFGSIDPIGKTITLKHVWGYTGQRD
jgi:putative ABC transport system permease protein